MTRILPFAAAVLLVSQAACADLDDAAMAPSHEGTATGNAPRRETPAPPAASAPNDVTPSPTAAPAPQYAVRTFPIPKKGRHVVLGPSASLNCQLRVPSREFDFPEDATDARVSETGKTMCFTFAGEVLCHTSGTGTGLCHDTFDNVANALSQPATRDGTFVATYLAAHGERVHATISGHSQGAYDASRVAPLLGKGDQLFLLQPASSALAPNRALLDARARGATVVVAWSTNDDASLGIRGTAGDVPLLAFPLQEGIRVHNAPNARDLFLRHFGIPDDRTVSPALDASILSNPGSPTGPWRFPHWQEL